MSIQTKNNIDSANNSNNNSTSTLQSWIQTLPKSHKQQLFDIARKQCSKDILDSQITPQKSKYKYTKNGSYTFQTGYNIQTQKKQEQFYNINQIQYKRFIGYEGANIHTNSYGKLERIVFEDQDYLDSQKKEDNYSESQSMKSIKGIDKWLFIIEDWESIERILRIKKQNLMVFAFQRLVPSKYRNKVNRLVEMLEKTLIKQKQRQKIGFDKIISEFRSKKQSKSIQFQNNIKNQIQIRVLQKSANIQYQIPNTTIRITPRQWNKCSTKIQVSEQNIKKEHRNGQKKKKNAFIKQEMESRWKYLEQLQQRVKQQQQFLLKKSLNKTTQNGKICY